MGPAPIASGATRGSSETDELLVKEDASASRGADVRDADERRSSAARTAVRVAAVGACALAGVAAVSGDVFGHFAGVAAFGGSDDRARLGVSREGRWAAAFDLADDPAFSLRDGKRGAWGAARGVVGPTSNDASSEGTETRRAGSSHFREGGSISSLTRAPALTEKKPSRFQKWDRAPYEYEMPAVSSSLGVGNVDAGGDASGISGDPQDRVRLGAAREQSLRGDGAATHPKVARAAERARANLRHRRFAAADLGDALVDFSAPSSSSDAGPAGGARALEEPAPESEAYEYDERYDNDGSVPWDVVYAPPPVPPAPGKPPVPPAPRKPTSEEVAAIGKASAGAGTYYPYNDRVVRVAPWGAGSTPSSANDGALRPREPDTATAKTVEAARAARRAKEERLKRLEADGGKLTTTARVSSDDEETVASVASVASSSAEEGRTKNSKRASAKRRMEKRRERPASETARGGDYDDAWLDDVRAKKTMNRAEKNVMALSEREFRDAFVGVDYDDASALLDARRRGKMTAEEMAEARAGGLMASLGGGATSADVESYEADLAAGRVFASPAEDAAAKAEAKARYEAEAAWKVALERARNEDGSIRWDASQEVREALEAAANSAERSSGGSGSEPSPPQKRTFREGERPTRARTVNPDGSVPWDAPEVPTYVFNEELRSRLGGEEGADASLAWDEKPESELISSFVSAAPSLDAYGDSDDPQESDEGAVAWTVAFDADAAAGDGALDEALRAEEAYDPSQSDHYLDDLLRPSDDALESGVFGDEAAAVGAPRRRSHARRSDTVTGDEGSGVTVAWNDVVAWHSAVTGEASETANPEEDERAETREGEGDAAEAEEDDESAFGERWPREIEFDVRDYDVGALGARARADPRLEPQSYEDELETGHRDDAKGKGRPFRVAALGEAAISKTREPARLFRRSEPDDAGAPVFEAKATCEQTSARTGGPNRDELLCQRYAGDARACQTYVAPAQSCWHKTVGGAFLDPASANPALGARGGRGPPTGKEDAAASAKWREAFYGCMTGDPEFTGSVDAPYRLPLAPAREPAVAGEASAGASPASPAPPLTPKFFRATRPGTAYFYHFVHIPKAGGTYFKSLLHASETRRQRRLGGPDPRWDQDLVNTWNTKPLVDMTEWSFANVAWRYVEGAKRGAAVAKLATNSEGRVNATGGGFDNADANALANLGRAERDADRVLGASSVTPQFTGPGMRASYQQGHRAVSKSSLTMGACDMVDAPCAYLTVLRDPWEKFMSFYRYACLEGSEDMGAWTDEWRRDAQEKGYDENGCPASPTQFYKGVGGMVEVLAPGATPDSHCAVEAAKRNLASPCMRFLLLEQLEEGLSFMRDALPDFADIGTERAKSSAGDAAARAQAKMVDSRRNGSGAHMNDAKRKRLDAYRADEREMRELRRLMAGELEVYRFAKEERYRAQWEEPLQTC